MVWALVSNKRLFRLIYKSPLQEKESRSDQFFIYLKLFYFLFLLVHYIRYISALRGCVINLQKLCVSYDSTIATTFSQDWWTYHAHTPGLTHLLTSAMPKAIGAKKKFYTWCDQNDIKCINFALFFLDTSISHQELPLRLTKEKFTWKNMYWIFWFIINNS